jgi:hypothetical protein
MGGGYLCPEPNIMLWFAYPSHFPQAEKEMCKAEQTVHIDTCPASSLGTSVALTAGSCHLLTVAHSLQMEHTPRSVRADACCGPNCGCGQEKTQNQGPQGNYHFCHFPHVSTPPLSPEGHVSSQCCPFPCSHMAGSYSLPRGVFQSHAVSEAPELLLRETEV